MLTVELTAGFMWRHLSMNDAALADDLKQNPITNISDDNALARWREITEN